jgi:glycerol kinase
LVVDSYFSATKLRWILDHIENGQQRAENGELLFGTIDTWLIWNYTKGKTHATDLSNASRTMLFNINTLEWDEEILNFLKIPKAILPQVKESSADYGNVSLETSPILGLKICGVAGDQQAALFGQDCLLPGTAKNTYGTGCFMLMNTGEVPVKSENGLLTTIAWGINGKVNYALEGSIFIAGAAIQWLRDGLRVIEKSSESEFFAQKVENTEGVYVVPAFTGLGAPYWNMSAKGGILGLTRGTSLEHIIRATLESVAYQTRDVLDAMTLDSKIELKALKVDGGASNNNFLMKFQADILGVSVQRPAVTEVTAMGAGKLALLFSEKGKLFKESTYTEFRPSMEENLKNELYSGWKDAVRKVMA